MSIRFIRATGRAAALLALAGVPACDGVHRVGSSDGGQHNDGGGGNGGAGAGGAGGAGGARGCGRGTTFGGASSPWKNPEFQCAWSPPDHQVVTTPVVVDLDKDGKPEVIFLSRLTTGGPGKLHAIRGGDCSEVWSVDTKVSFGTDLAAGDLDGDGRPEVVGFYETTSGNVVEVHGPDGALLTTSEPFVTGQTFAPALADVDGDGHPEIVLGAAVMRFEGGPTAKVSLLWAGTPPRSSNGLISLVADVDLDGKPEVVAGTRIFEGLTGKDKAPPALAALPLSGLTAVAQMEPSTPQPEIALVTNGSVSALDPLTGAAVFGPIATVDLTGSPTIADFDGDGRREIGVASRGMYRVYSPACSETPLPAGCKAPGILWESETQDGSGNTGSTVFDFNDDCAAEVVYRDECWLRIYDGATGTVRAAYSITSITGHEEPVVADVDGDGHAEIVVSSDDMGYGSGHPSRCPELPEAHTGAPWGGPTHGIFILRDPDRRWAPARRVWNQHTYHVTNVDEDGTIPAIERNSWEVHNNYRQNVKP